MACNTDSNRRLQTAYCKFLNQSYTFAEKALAEIIPRREEDENKTVIMDFDAVFASEDACTNYEMFTCAVDFVKSMKARYGSEVKIVIITARQDIKDLKGDLDLVGLTYGPRVASDADISQIMYDANMIGTKGSKLRNRRTLRKQGATILASIGDNLTDLVSDAETDMYADTLNILLPNIYRHNTLFGDRE